MVANRNLNQEGMIPEYIHSVGNILIDTIRYNRHRLVQPLWFSSEVVNQTEKLRSRPVRLLKEGINASISINSFSALIKRTNDKTQKRPLTIKIESDR